tara:strand:+ start:101 stop:280 length:180 start_codon:yes stop_codon:yes gene_type:complete
MFYITYFAKKHAKFITRKGQLDKPDGTKGKSFVSKNGPMFNLLGFRRKWLEECNREKKN